jgi:hypothetical protein
MILKVLLPAHVPKKRAPLYKNNTMFAPRQLQLIRGNISKVATCLYFKRQAERNPDRELYGYMAKT